jgi:tyrosinase
MWQALNPDSYITPAMNPSGSYYVLKGSVDTETTGLCNSKHDDSKTNGVLVLAPFHSDSDGTMFTSDDIRGTVRLGYSYPELPDWRMTREELTLNVRKAVNTLYSPFSNQTRQHVPAGSRVRSTSIAEAFGNVSLDLARNLNVNNLDRQWSISVLVDQFALDTSFCIDFFIGDPPDDVSARPTAGNLIGTYAQFGPVNATMQHLQTTPQVQVQGQVPMTHVLAAGVSRGLLRDLSVKSVVPLLRTELMWKARSPAGADVPITSLTGLSISVSTRSLAPRTREDEFPTYGPEQLLYSVTESKPCGARRR